MAFVYSCCFWFSLRLGGILIAAFSLDTERPTQRMSQRETTILIGHQTFDRYHLRKPEHELHLLNKVQSVIILIATGIAHAHPQRVKETLSNWMSSMKFGYAKIYVEYVRDDPEKYTTILLTATSFYVILCVLFIYGAYTCNNSLMFGYIAVEALRLMALSLIVITWLLLLKLNTMDIGLLIGASVAGGFALLGMFYLWVCAANLPILINEMEREEQEETIEKLRRQLEEKRALGFNYDANDLPRLLRSDAVVAHAIVAPEKRLKLSFHDKHADRRPVILASQPFSYIGGGNNNRYRY